MTLSEVAIRRPVFTTMVSLAIIVLGVVGLTRLPVNLFPDVEFPVVSVVTLYPGASPLEVESEVTKRIEDALVSIEGIDMVWSYSRDSVSQVVLQFELDVDLDQVANEVREQASSIRAQLPREAEEPSISRLNISAAPILTFTVSGAGTPRELRDVAEDLIAPQLEQIEGVATARVRGGAEPQVNVLLDAERLRARGLSLAQIGEKLRSENNSVPAGDYDEGTQNVSVRTVGELETLDQIRDLAVSVDPNGTIVRLSEVAEVENGAEDVDIVVRSNRAPAVVIDVLKASGRNTVEVSKLVRERLANLTLPPGVETHMIVDQAEFVLENMHEVEVALFFGGAMAILVILLFMLDLRSTLISAVALPTSVIGSFLLMYGLGFSLNMMTLLGLSLAIGLLVDDSIVVRENIVKHIERGADPIRAAIDGTREITLAVLATTATLCAVFVPVAFTGGMVGQFFREFGITVAGATVLSAWVALTLDPMLSAKFAKPHVPNQRSMFDVIVRPMRRFYAQLDAVYADTLRFIVSKKRWMALVIVAAIGIFFGANVLAGSMGSEFTSIEDRGEFNVGIELPAGTSLEETARLSLLAETEVLRDPRFITVYATVGASGGPNVADWRVMAVPKWERTAGLLALEDFVREIVQRTIPGAKVGMTLPGIVDGEKQYPIALYVQGDRYEDIERMAYRYRDLMRAIPGMTDVSVDYAAGKPELRLEVMRDRAAQLGVPLGAVASTVRTAMEGDVVGRFRDADDEIDIRVRLRPEDRQSEALVRRLEVPSPVGFLPITDVARVVRGDGPAVIERLDRLRSIKVVASPGDRPLGDVVTEMMTAVNAVERPPGITVRLEGDAKMMAESNESLGIALLLGVIFIYLVLASQFESFIHPVTIMMALPLAIVGAMIGLFLYGASISMGAMIGIILLMGLVTKNGILLVDHAVVRVRDGLTPKEAILEAGPARLRPILMTSAAMVLGMLPTATGNGPGSEFRAPMAIAVIGGVVSSTFLTLFVVPVFYLAVEAGRRFLRRFMPGRAAVMERLESRT